MLASGFIVIVGAVTLLTPGIDAALAGFALAFAARITDDLLGLLWHFIELQQCMVAVERVKEFTEIEQEPPELVNPPPPAAWPEHGKVTVENLHIRYAVGQP
jgi:ABC-type multidrug transport system fused ATPase/permease subunit